MKPGCAHSIPITEEKCSVGKDASRRPRFMLAALDVLVR